MRTLSNNEFKTRLQSLEIVHDCLESYAMDSIDTVVKVNTSSNELWTSETIAFDGEEYEMTDEQQQMLIDLIYDDNDKNTNHYQFYASERNISNSITD